jgi:hypothetical protein
MKRAFQRTFTMFLVLAFGLGPAPTRGFTDDSIAKIMRITATDRKEVPYPTPLVQLVTDRGAPSDVSKNMPVKAGEAVLTKSANTFVRMEGKGAEAFLYSNTFVRFDDLNIWLIRSGAMFVVNKRGKLEVVAEGLGRLLVNSKVYLRAEGSELLAYVTEGRVVLEADVQTLSLGPGEAGRIPMGDVPQRASLTPEEKASISTEIETAKQGMKGGGGGGLGAALAVAAAAAAAGVILATRDKGDKGDRGGPQGLPDLVPVVDSGKGACRLDDSGYLLVTVRNQGQADAPASTTQVEFEVPAYGAVLAVPAGRRSALTLTTPPLRAGQAADLRVLSVQRVRSVQNLKFRITVDSGGRVSEANEENNSTTVSCPGGPG